MPFQIRHALYAPVCIIAGMAIVAVSDNFIGEVSERMGLGQFQAMRSAAALALVAALVLAAGRIGRLKPVNPRGLAVRTLFNVTALMIYFAALPTVPIAQAAAGMFTSPVWVAVLTGLFFGVSVGPRRVAGVLLGFAGVVLVLKVGQEPLRPMALSGVAAGFFYAMSVIWTRRHCAGETAVCIAFWNFVGYGSAGLALMLLGPALAGDPAAGSGDLAFLLRGWEAPTLAAVLIAAAIGVTSILASAFLAEGYKSGESSTVALFDFSFLLWAPLFAWLLRGEILSGRQLAGMALIIAAGSLAVWSGARRAVPDRARNNAGENLSNLD